MWNRREILGALTAAALTPAWLRAAEDKPRKKLAMICTHWTMQSHAQHMGDRFLVGYPHHGRWHRPPLDVVSLYVDQKPEGDQSASRAAEFGFRIFPTIAETLCLGGDKLAVDAVLIIGEHGDYPLNEIGQKQYPRYEFFKQATDVFRRSGRAVPVFNDKHLSWKYEWAEEMVRLSKELKFGFCAGSSLPSTFRMPSVDLPFGAKVDEALVVAFGPADIYDFHALEALQSFVERRAGGETGVEWIEALRGPAVWDAFAKGSWDAGGWSPKLFEACLSRSHTLGQAQKGFGHRYPTADELRTLSADPILYRYRHRDGLKSTMLLANGLVEDFNVAAQIVGQEHPVSTQMHLPPKPNVAYSAPLMADAEATFLTNRSPRPIERTLLTSGLVTFGMTSQAQKKRLMTPQLAVTYQAPRESLFSNE